MSAEGLRLMKISEVADRLPGFKVPACGWRIRPEELKRFLERYRGGNGKR